MKGVDICIIIQGASHNEVKISLINTSIERSLSMDPWGMPLRISVHELKLFPILILCFLLGR